MTVSNRNKLACAVALALAAPTAMAAPVFYQGFDISSQMPPQPGCNTGDFPGGAGTYPFPAGWLLRNVDNHTPATNVAYVNDAWEVREDFSGSVTNCVAFSTSWYSSPAAADDWMWTPAIALPAGNSTLTWRAKAYDPAYPDGYEVRVMASPSTPTGGTGVIGNQITNSIQVFSVASEQASWTSHSVPLNTFSGQTVYVGFRNNSFDKFLLVVDDVTVMDSTPDAVAQLATPPYASPYARAPDGFTVDASLGFSAYNGGGIALTNLIGTAQYQLNGSPVGTPLQATTIPTLAVGASSPESFGTGNTFSGTGNWTVQYAVTAMESGGETNSANNVVQAPGVAIGGNEFARAEGAPSGVLGIGGGNGGELGEAYTLRADTTISGIRFGMGPQSATIDDGMGNLSPNPFIGAPLVANLRAYDNTTPPGKPGALIDTTVPVTATTQGGVYDVAFSTGPHLLTAGTYVVTVSEPVQNQAMTLPMHMDRFVPGTVWVNWPTAPTGDWANIETFGALFLKTPEVSMLVEISIFKDGFGLPGGNRPSNGVQAWREPLPLAPARQSRKAAPTQLSTER
jgi:hypothetical protein